MKNSFFKIVTNYTDAVKYGLLSAIFIVLFSPFLMELTLDRVFNPLKGDVKSPENVEFDLDNWIEGSYQQKKEEHLNEVFGFRSVFVRTNNQIVYSLFNKAKANGVIVGKENYLYELDYINAYAGNDYIGDDSVSYSIGRLKFISDTLNKIGKQLVVVFAAGKASFYPEYIPDNYLPFKEKTNYKMLSSAAVKAGLNVIDFNKWFIENKQKSKHPLFPMYGIHWSSYAVNLVADSLVKKIGYLRGMVLPTIKITDIKMAQPFDSDYDIGDGMNLLFVNKSFVMAYPKITFENTDKVNKPKVLVISDSFYWGMYNMGISNCFANDHFWYYNRQVYPQKDGIEKFTDQENIKNTIENHDVIVIMATEATLKNMSWGFAERLENYFKGNDVSTVGSAQYYKKVKDFVEYIKNDKKWLEDTRVRAEKKGISVDSALVLEAIWQIDNEK